MRSRILSNRTSRFFPVLALLIWVLAPGAGSHAAQRQSERKLEPVSALQRMMIPGTEDLQLIVELSEPDLLRRMRMEMSSRQAAGARLSGRNRRLRLVSSQALAHRRQISRTQELLKKRILDFPGAQVQGTTDILMNTVIVRAPAAHYRAIRRLPGVKKVYFSRPKRMLLDTAAAIQNAQDLWTAAGGQSDAGLGVKIGIIDSGIDVANPMFSDTGLSAPSGYPITDTPENLVFTNSKIIVARSYVSQLYYPQPIKTAVDEIGHGTFIAGCAAGEPVDAPLAAISGMAPGAFLGSYKIFGTPGINNSTTIAAELMAINDAVADGMDVINLSIGSLDYLPPEEDVEYAVLSRAVEEGVIVVIAAGNHGSMPHTISSPGSIPGAITVGSVTSSREFLAALHTKDPDLTIGYLPSDDGVQVPEDIPYTKVVDVASMDEDGLGCSAFPPGSLSGSVAFVERGTCTFATKALNAEEAGAIAVVVYNNQPVGLVGMIGLSSSTIPAVMISMTDGMALKQYINANPAGAQISIDRSSSFQAIATTARVVSAFSSVGPGMDFNIKPDLVAVGENVYSATVSTSGTMTDPFGFTVSQGTSFSAPMVAGAAAALRQRFPSLEAVEIKSLLTTTAGRNLTIDGVHPPNVLQAGSGLLNMAGAYSAGAVFSPTSLNFGVHSYSGSLSLSATLTVKNISSSPDQFTVELEPIVPGPSITFSSSTGTVAPGLAAGIDITLQVTAPDTGGFQGFINVRSSSTSFVYRIPYWAGLYVPDSTRVLPVSQSASGSGSFSSLADAVAAAQPGNIIQIEDDGAYPTGPDGLMISTNSEGLPLHGLTIRAAAGKRPVLEAASYTVGILIIGLRNVLLKGLDIEGGLVGVELYQPSASVPLSATIDQCTVANASGSSLSSGVWIDGGGSIDITGSTIRDTSGPAILSGLFRSGTQLTIVGTAVEGNEDTGLVAYDTNLHISNSSFTENLGPGVYLENCTGTVKGNTFSRNRTYYGDGIEIVDGSLAVKNNVFESNERMGIGLFSGYGDGPRVQITGNRIVRNGSYGILSNSSLFLLADGNYIESNGAGVYLAATADALLVNNIVAKSGGLNLGSSGIEIDEGSKARLVNNTIYRNALNGVVLRNGTASIDNSIIFDNAAGDLVGVAPGSSSLVSGDPLFVDPDSGDYSLLPDSPAIDAGSNVVPDLPFLDHYGRLRAASATGLPGQGTVDIGAVESYSAYPLVYPLTVNGSEPATGGTFTTGIAFTNPTGSAARLDFTGYDGAGEKLAGTQNPANVPLDPEEQLAMLDYQLFGFDSAVPSLGSVLGSSETKAAGFFLVCDPGFRRFSTGTNASPDASNDLVFMRHQSDPAGTASYFLFNPGTGIADITAALYDSRGVKVGQKTAAIAAKGGTALRFDSNPLSSGYVRISSDRPLSGVELVGKENLFAALGGFSPGTQSRLFFPHFAVGGNYSTQVGIVNTGASPTILTLDAYDDNGNLLARLGPMLLPARGQLLKTITELFGIPADGPLRTGYLVAQSDEPGIMGFTDFSYSDGGRRSDATIPADSAPSRRLLFSHIAHGVNAGMGIPYQTGIALLNPFGTAVDYTIKVYNGLGTLVAQDSQTIGPHQKVAKILTCPVEGVAFLTQDLVLGNGHIEVTADYGLIGLELFFTEDVSQLASVPAQIID